MGNKTHPIGHGTVNRTANLSQSLDSRLGRAVYATGAKSRGQVIRRALRAYLKALGESALLFVLGFILWAGASLVCVQGVAGLGDQERRGRSARVVRVVRAVRKIREI